MIKVDLEDIGYEVVDWTQLALEDARAGCCKHSNKLLGFTKIK
jgi:hypothetical protein